MEIIGIVKHDLIPLKMMSSVSFLRCQIAVHQECYGTRNVRDFTSWVCKACETPEIKRECCLCPVKGMSFLICSRILNTVFLVYCYN